MSIQDTFNNAVTRVQSNIAGMSAFREYISSFKDKLTKWTSGVTSGDGEFITVQIPQTDNTTVLAAVSQAQYAQALNGSLDYINLKVNDVGDTVSVAADTLLDAVERCTEELVLQNEFLSYSLDNDNVDRQTFLTSVMSKFQGFAGETVDRYAQLLSSKDPLQALQLFFATNANASKTTSQYVQLVYKGDYTGVSVVDVAWQHIADTVTGFFAGLEQYWYKITELIDKVKAGIKKMVRWIASKAFKSLTTTYEKASSAVGYIDCPLFQYNLGLYRDTWSHQLSTEATTLRNVLGNSFFDSHVSEMEGAVGTAAVAYTPMTAYINADGMKQLMRQMIGLVGAPCFEEVDGVTYSRPYDVIWSGRHSGSLLFRVGTDDAGQVYVFCYPIMAYADVSSMDDFEVAQAIHVTLSEFIESACSFSPSLPVSEATSVQDILDYVSAMTNEIMRDPVDPGSHDNYDLVSLLNLFDPDTAIDYLSHGSSSRAERVMRAFYFCILPYIVKAGPLYHAAPGIRIYFKRWAWMIQEPTSGGVYQFIKLADDPMITLFDHQDYAMANYDAAFMPYSQNQLLGCAVHYQNLDERASELNRALLTLFIAAAAVFATYKYIKFRRRRIAMQEITQGAVDNESWNIGQKPTPAQLQNYMKMKKTAKRVARTNSMLGLTSPSQTAASTITAINSIRDGLISLRGKNEDGTDCDGLLDTQRFNLVMIGSN